jgi:iron complex transport system ATP-binding protein
MPEDTQAATGPPVLEMRSVGYRVDGRDILSQIDWSLGRGEHWAILGPNGAGKTTLLRIACGYLWPNAGGQVLRLGRKLLDLRQLRRSIGWVTIGLAWRIPAGEQVLPTVVSGRFGQIGLRCPPHEEPDSEHWDRAAAYLEQMGCGQLSGRRFGTLSQGETQKVLIARAMMALPLVILLDEPCAGLDPGARERLLTSLAGLLQADGPGMVYVTHHIEEILPAVDRALLLKDGRVLQAGPTEQVLDESTIGQLYDMPVHLQRHAGRTWASFG